MAVSKMKIVLKKVQVKFNRLNKFSGQVKFNSENRVKKIRLSLIALNQICQPDYSKVGRKNIRRKLISKNNINKNYPALFLYEKKWLNQEKGEKKVKRKMSK